jgi:hypothetical protein
MAIRSSLVAMCALCLLPTMSLALDNQAVDAERGAFNARQTSVTSGIALIEQSRAALVAYYMANSHQWPPSMQALVATGYLSSTESPWGESIVGASAGVNYTLNLTTPAPEVAQGIAGRMGGSVNNETVAVSVPIPATASIMDNGLMRFSVAGRPELNQMGTNLDMAGYNVNNVEVIDATKANVDTLEVSTLLQVLSDATFTGDVSIAGSLEANEVKTPLVTADKVVTDQALVQELVVENTETQTMTVNDTLTVNGKVDAIEADITTAMISTLTTTDHAVLGGFEVSGSASFYGDAYFKNGLEVLGGVNATTLSSTGQISEGGSFLSEKYLGISAKAKDAENADYADNAGQLGGVDAGQYAQMAKANTYSGLQTFNGGISTSTLTVNGATVLNSALTVNANTALKNNLTVSGYTNLKGGANIQGGNLTVNSANDVLVGNISLKSLYQDVVALQSQSGSGSITGKWKQIEKWSDSSQYPKHRLGGLMININATCSVGDLAWKTESSSGKYTHYNYACVAQ